MIVTLPEPAMDIDALDHLVLTVADLDATVAFYVKIGMQAVDFEVADGTRRRALRFGSQKINLHPATEPYRPHAARPGPGTADLCFLSSRPLADWIAHLAAEGLAIEEGPVPRSGATGPIVSIYLRDPDGNLIEIANRA